MTIPNSVTSIGYAAFYDCSGLTEVTIPNSVTSIGDYAFYGCSGLKKANFESVESLCKIEFNSYTSNPLYNTHNLYINGEEVKALVIPNSVTSIGDYAFWYCSGLTDVTIPNSVTSIGNRAFQGCSGLTEVTIPNSVTSIGDYAFRTCSGLTQVTIGSSVTSIGKNAFDGCSGLTEVTIPNSVTSIGDYAFWYCSGLTEVTIPNSVTSIGYKAFSGCSGLSKINVSWTNPVYINSNIFDNSVYDEAKLYIQGNLPSYLESNWSLFKHIYVNGNPTVNYSDGILTYKLIENPDFREAIVIKGNYSSLTDISIPDKFFYDSNSSEPIIYNVSAIGPDAFSGCGGLTEVTIPNSVTSIGKNAFRYCSGLTEVTIPNSVTSIGQYAFYGCSGLKKANFESVESLCKIEFNDDTSNPLSNAHNLYINGEEVKALVIPNSVTSIGDYAFSGCSCLTHVTIPNSVTSIGNAAFSGCSGLTRVTIPSSVTSIGWSTFWYCSGLTEVTIPNSVTSIGKNAFGGCIGLKKANFESVESLCKIEFGPTSNPLENAHNLYINGEEVKALVIPNSVTSIGDYAFSGCSGLTDVTIPNSVTSIGKNAFYDCSGLTEVTIPNSVTSIGDYAFYGCKGLTQVICKALIPSAISRYTFDDDNYKNAKLLVGKDVIPAYKENQEWCRFVNIAAYTSAESITLDKERYEAEPNMQFQLTATVLPEDAVDKTLEWSSSDESVTSVDQTGLVTTNKSGSAKIYVSLKSNPDITATCDVTVIKYNQTIKWDQNFTDIKVGDEVELTAIASSGLDVEYASSAPEIAKIEDNVVKFLSAGKVRITACQSGNDEFEQAQSVAKTIIIDKKFQTINWTQDFADVKVGDELELKASSSSNLPVIYTSSDENIAEIKGNMVTFKSAGEVEITATQSGNDKFEAAERVTKTIVVYKKSQSIEWMQAISEVKVGDEIELTAIASSGLEVEYASSNEKIAKIEGNVVKFLSAGKVVLTASQPGNDEFEEAESVVKTIVVGKKSQSIEWTQEFSEIKVGDEIELTAVASSGLEVEYASPDYEIAQIRGNVVKFLSAGEVMIIAYQPGNNEFEEAESIEKIVLVSPILVESILLDSSDVLMEVGDTKQLTATVLPENATNDNIEWASSDNEVATVTEDGLIAAVGEGIAVITVRSTDGSNISASCNITVSGFSSVENISASDCRIFVKNNTLYVTGVADTQEIKILNLNGVCVYEGIKHIIPLQSGVYIVIVNDKIKKVII